MTPEVRDILKILWKSGEIAQINFIFFLMHVTHMGNARNVCFTFNYGGDGVTMRIKEVNSQVLFSVNKVKSVVEMCFPLSRSSLMQSLSTQMILITYKCSAIETKGLKRCSV